MSIYGRVQSGLIVELVTPATGFTMAECFHPSFVAQCVEVDGFTPAPQVGWTATQNGSSWTFAPPAGPTLAQAQATQAEAMRAACQGAIEGGFTSSGLGTPTSYPSDSVTQRNIMLAADHGGAIWCQPSGGTWAYTQHTEAQATQVEVDMAAFIQTQQAQYATLLSAIQAATTVAAVQAVVW
jgi:hypothetical protein